MKLKLLLFFLLLLSARSYSQDCNLAAPTAPGATVCANGRAVLSVVSPGDSFQWFDAPTGGLPVATGPGYTTPALTVTTSYYVQVTTNGCTSERRQVIVVVNPVTEPPVVDDVTICSGSSTTLTAGGPGDIFQWYAAPTGGQPLITSPDYTTPVLTATTTYYVQTRLNGCISERRAVTVTVNPIPAAPTTGPGQTICAGSAAVVTASSNGGAISWYASAGSGTVLGTGASFTTGALTATTTFYAAVNEGGCSSPRVPVTVTVNPIPAAPSAAGAIICNGGSTTLTAFAPGGTYEWYDAATGGTLVYTGAAFPTGPLTETRTYYVQTTVSNCQSPRAPVTVTVNPAVAPPSAADASACSGSSAVLSASGSTGSYAWYTSATGGTPVATTADFVTPPLSATTTYYVETSINGCISSRTPVTVNILQPPAAPSATNTTTCPGTPATLTATTPSGTLEWYDSATGGLLLFTGPSYMTPPLTAATTYYVQANNGSCSSGRTAVTASLYPVTDPEFRYARRTYLRSGADPAPFIFEPSGGIFTASPAGLVFVDPSTGRIDVSASAAGSYVITFTNAGPCPQNSVVTITITDSPGTGFSYSDPSCQYDMNISPVFQPGATPGTFTASPAGLVFYDSSTGEIDLAQSNPGNYVITNTAPDGSFSTYNIRIRPRAVVDAGPAQTVLAGTSVTLSGSTTLAGSLLWSGGTGSFSDATVTNPVYTPGPGETTAALVLNYTTPNSCPSVPDTVLVTFIADPTVADASTCYNSSGTLTASGPGETYEWFDGPTSASPIQTGGASFTSPPLTVSTTYYVRSVIAGVTTGRTAATINVASRNGPIIANPVTICYADVATLTASGADTYRWYDAGTGGNLLSATNTYITPVLYANTVYYVEGTFNGCRSGRIAVNVTVNPLPAVTSPGATTFCSGESVNYTIRADQPGTTFTWSRAAVPGITTPQGNTELFNQTSATIAETLISTNTVATVVTYSIIPVSNGCSGPAFSYRVTVNPVPIVTSAATQSICNNTAPGYTVTFNVQGTSFTWSRAAVTGISNAAISGQRAGTIRESLTNNTNAPIDVTYTYTLSTAFCQGQVFNYVVTVNPTIRITSPINNALCTGTPLNYTITSQNTPATTFTWKRDALPGISNPAVATHTSSVISETLINTANAPVIVAYVITPTAFGCVQGGIVYRVTVYPTPVTPVISSNSPVCQGDQIQLSAADVPGATYSWTGPGGFNSTLREPVISGATTANAGDYKLTVIVNGCSSAEESAPVIVTQPPVTNAGGDIVVCSDVVSVPLNGVITGGGDATQGIWATSGSGTFMPSNTALNASYLPSTADRETVITLTLASTANGNCPAATSSLALSFQHAAVVNAGPDQDICSQNTFVALAASVQNAQVVTWTTSGTGSFSPSVNDINALYYPSSSDISNGIVLLTLTSSAVGLCGPFSDALNVRFIPPPVISAGEDRLVLLNKSITLQPATNDPNVQYLWTPNLYLSDNTVKNPVVKGTTDQLYTLTVTDSRGCVSTDEVYVQVLDPLTIPNTFTPNGDGINDVWNIPQLPEYPNYTITIFTRYGEKVYSTATYQSWNGYYNGSPLPFGTYYYVIETRFEGKVYAGSITIIR